MWRRVLLVLVVYSAIAVIGLAVPLAITLGRERMQRFGENRLAAASYFADLAARADDAPDPELQQVLQRYHQLYDEPVVVVGRDGRPRAAAGVSGIDGEFADAAADALRNQRSRLPDAVTPWSPARVLIAVPVGTGTQVDGAVVLAASTAAARTEIGRAWALIAAAAVGLLVLASAIAVALSRWTVRPLTDLAGRAVSLRHRVRDRAPTDPPTVDEPIHGRYAGPHEVRRLAATFDAMARDIDAADAAQRRLIADSAHALRNPLAALSMRLDTLGMALPESSVAAHHKATLEVDRLTGIVNDLLALASAESRAETDAAGHTVDVGAIAAERVEFWAAAMTDAGIDVTVETLPAVPAVLPEQDLTQILDIALSNIAKYAGPGAHAQVTVARHDADVVLLIRDDGRGVPTRDLPRVATRFFRAANTVGKGSGLGLAIARALIERAGGTFEVDSGRAGGLCLTMRIPAPMATDSS
ncbi:MULTISPECIES: sensor histidine kinase [Mycobacteriaceae]|uniref:histidine kinase n=1 Tax=Mycolicibacterium neoaurum VKM Ac-1815D TaxID=700508 RepID=V5XIC3_MYCNE|nr:MULTISPECIES: HAMP domain-containing sensor histidine kinase [Mycobacteriaceae]AHC27451.1 histidine kinase [Mycolicibacterium neoaurum VKM Ac-1815D]AMO07662.1 histidine kinase [Mycolicibacterium neoaurum]AXK73948.1 sensor histidine kinase [Mycolicibacterium neoaurum]KJQ51616.1 histidine kinase [Mycolicibacterium neoaurum]KUM08806.1 histidine kinase [Mycolicibacterium neoaurum]